MMKFIRNLNIQFFAPVQGQTTQNFPNEIRDYYDRVALKRALALMTFRKWGQKRPLPKNQGETILFRRWGKLAPAMTPLQEGVTPLGSKMDYTDVRATVEQYGDWIPVTDRVLLTGIDPWLTEASEVLGEQEGETHDLLMRNHLMAGSMVIFGNGDDTDEVNTKIADTHLKTAVRMLKMGNVPTIKKQVNATTNYGTSALRAAYVGVVHPYVTQDLEGITGFVPVEEYSAQQDIMEGEVGSYKGIRFVETTNAMVWEGGGAAGGTNVTETGANADIYPIVIFGEDAYGEVPLAGGSHRIIIKVKGDDDSHDSSDPLNQRGSAGWKSMWTGKILDDTRMVRIEVAAGV